MTKAILFNTDNWQNTSTWNQLLAYSKRRYEFVNRLIAHYEPYATDISALNNPCATEYLSGGENLQNIDYLNALFNDIDQSSLLTITFDASEINTLGLGTDGEFRLSFRINRPFSFIYHSGAPDGFDVYALDSGEPSIIPYPQSANLQNLMYNYYELANSVNTEIGTGCMLLRVTLNSLNIRDASCSNPIIDAFNHTIYNPTNLTFQGYSENGLRILCTDILKMNETTYDTEQYISSIRRPCEDSFGGSLVYKQGILNTEYNTNGIDFTVKLARSGIADCEYVRLLYPLDNFLINDYKINIFK